MPSLFHKGDTMIRLLQRLLLLFTLTIPQLCATPGYVHFGDGISLMTAENLYLTMTPGAANAGTISDTQGENNYNVFQIFDANGNNGGATVNYGQTVALQLTTNNVWVTLDPATDDTPGYVRNNAPQQLSWEQLKLVPVGSGSGPINYNDQVYLGHTYNQIDFVYVMINESTVTTTNNVNGATPFTITTASFTGYSQGTPSETSPLSYQNLFAISYNSSYLNVNAGLDNAGAISGSPTPYIILSSPDQSASGQVVYGAPIYLGNDSSVYYITMNIPSPYSSGHVRNNVQYTPSVWEQMYFIPAHSTNNAGTSRNGDLVYYFDNVYLARNGLIEGTFQTEYVTIDGDGNVSTTFDFGSASLLQIGGLG